MLDFFLSFTVLNWIMYTTTSLCLICSGIIFFSENSIYSTLSFLVTVVLLTILLIIYGLEFFAVIYLFVYAGAIIVTFLFVIITVNLRKEDTLTSKKRLKDLLPSAILTGIFAGILSYYIFSFNAYFDYVHTERILDVISGSKRVEAQLYLGDYMIFNQFLYTEYAPYLILLGILLLVSVVGSVALCLHTLRTLK